ncbi:hypothetical protein [Bartonella sp. OT172YNZD]|uniref:hypothetical protein n=1 Tax=Bartonella sp. OT172YNZD TaxID=3243572 RepID=UPI0035D01BA7
MKGQVLFYCGDNDVRYAFVLGGGNVGEIFSRYETGGYEEKSLCMRNCGRFARGKGVGWFIGG